LPETELLCNAETHLKWCMTLALSVPIENNKADVDLILMLPCSHPVLLPCPSHSLVPTLYMLFCCFGLLFDYSATHLISLQSLFQPLT
jgi:hypothetical protein